MRENAGYYKQFIEVNVGGGTRRNPKRKTAGSFTTSNLASMPSPEDVDRVFDSHLLRMAQGGTYGDNMEIVAFSAAFKVDVKIWQRDYAFMVSGPGEDSNQGVCHIAYHVSMVLIGPEIAINPCQTWEHYSSIRNLDGPHDGVPNVQPKEISSEEEDKQQKEKLKNALKVPSWQIQLVAASLPYPVDEKTIEQRIQDYKGDANEAINSFFENDEVQDFSSTQESSVEPDVESNEDSSAAPTKKQDRRLSRAAKMNHRHQEERKRRGVFLNLSQDSKSLESLLVATSSSSATSDQKPSSLQEPDSDEDDWTPGPLKDGDTSSGSDYSSIPVAKIKLRLPNPSSGPSGVIKSSPPKKKKMVSARVMKDLKKQAQKTAAKERRQVAAGVKPSQESSSSVTTTPAMTTGIRTLYI